MIHKFVRIFSLICFALLVSSSALGYDMVVVNSHDWQDVYNSLLYGALSNTPVMFLSDQSQSNVFFDQIPYSANSILVVESDQRLSPTASRILDSLGYEVEILSDEDTSLFFSSELNLDSYIVVDKNFPAHGISVAPYAVATNSWVFFVEGSPSQEILDEIGSSQVVTYGRLSQGALQALSPFLVIDEGNKYRNSVEMATEFLSRFPTKQFVLTQGSFLESELFVKSFPVLIVGVSSTPQPIVDFFVESQVESAVVIGQLSVPASVELKRLLESEYDKNIKLVAKLGQTSSTLDNPDTDIIPLNIFPIPSPEISVQIESAFYNQITRQIELRLTNDGDILTSYVPSIVLSVNGESRTLDAPLDFYDLERSESRTIQFPADLSVFDEVSAQVTVSFGESSDSLDSSESQEFSPLEMVSIVDESSLEIQHIVYDQRNNVFLVEVFNNGSVPTYADITLFDVIVGGDLKEFSSTRPVLIQPGQSGFVVIYAVLSEIDILANPFISYELLYGQRNYALIYSVSGELPLEEVSFFDSLSEYSGLLIGGVAFVIFCILIIFILRKRKKKNRY